MLHGDCQIPFDALFSGSYKASSFKTRLTKRKRMLENQKSETESSFAGFAAASTLGNGFQTSKKTSKKTASLKKTKSFYASRGRRKK